MAMRSGPSTRTTAWVARRHVNWCGGPSGTVANGTLMGPERYAIVTAQTRGPPSGRPPHDPRPAGAGGDTVDQGGQFVIGVHEGLTEDPEMAARISAAGGQADKIEAE